MAPPAALRVEGIGKRFPGVLALRDVTLEVAAGSCHALCGENGAGKSTLARILAGIYRPDRGRIVLRGRPVRFAGPRDALSAGVGLVHQEPAFCENLSVAENLCLGALPARRGLLDRAELRRRARAMLEEIGAGIDPAVRLGELSIAQRQLVQIAHAVGSAGSTGIIVFDEPTSSLSEVEALRLFDLVQRLKRRGVTCIYVSHRMPEVFRLCDTATVLRDGQAVATRNVAKLAPDELVRLMIGRPVADYLPATEGAPGEELLRVEALTLPGSFAGVSFTLRAGEILGLAGLVGAGRSEVAQALFGLHPGFGGRLWLRGRAVRLRAPAEAIRQGIGLVPEDRKRQGLVPLESAVHNLSLPLLRRLSRLGWVRRRRERGLARGYFDQLRIARGDLDAIVAGLSGGNQQKLVLARWLAAGSRILLLDEPTRGVDVGAKAEIHRLIGALAAQGHAILLISSELPEILTLSSRILVLRAGRLVAELPRAGATQEELLRLMAGFEQESSGD